MKKLFLFLSLILLNLNILVIVLKSDLKDKKQDAMPIVIHDTGTLPDPIELIKPKYNLPEFVEVPVFREVNEVGTIYADVLSHSKRKPVGDKDGRSTNVHETTHFINNYLLQKYYNPDKIVNGFYVLNGKGVLIEEPHFKRHLVQKFVPETLRSYIWLTYFEKDESDGWQDRPLYILDEWTAYILDAKSAVEDARKAKENDVKITSVDAVSGCLDFSIYAIALCMAVKEHDPKYWETNIQFKSFVMYQLKEACATFKSGSEVKEFATENQSKLLKEFLTGEGAKPYRDFLNTEFEGVWLK